MAYRTSFVIVVNECGFVYRHAHIHEAEAFSKVIGQYVKEKKLLFLIETLENMNIMPTDRVGFSQKGEIMILPYILSF